MESGQPCPHCGKTRVWSPDGVDAPDGKVPAMQEVETPNGSVWLCHNPVCILDRKEPCTLLGHIKTNGDRGHTVCKRCEKTLEERDT